MDFFPGLTSKEIAGLKRLPFSGLSPKGLELFRVPIAARKKAAEMERKTVRAMKTKEKEMFAKTLKGVEKVLGFKLP